MKKITEDVNKTKEMLNFEEETGLKAIHNGRTTKSFERWKKGEKVYKRDKERLGIYLSSDEKKRWQELAEEKEIKTLSDLVRTAVENFASSEKFSKKTWKNAEISHDLKEPLTVIMGYAQFLLENPDHELDDQCHNLLTEILKNSKALESKIKEIFEEPEEESIQIDIMIVDDDGEILTFLKSFLKFKGYKCEIISDSSDLLNIIPRYNPKLILLDIVLPGQNGLELCKKIKLNPLLKDIPIFFITALPETEVKENLPDSGAEGYFLKPFDINEFDILKQYL